MQTFRAMNTDVTVVAPGRDDVVERTLAAEVAAIFEASERRFSRFRADSELSRLNRADGPLVVSPELFAVLRRARAYTLATHGLFDPAIGAELGALGYDRSFAPGALDRAAPSSPPRRARFADVLLDDATGSVTRPREMQIDLGGLVKGRTADEAAALAEPPFAIDAGGDAVLRGDGPDGTGWIVDVEDPHDASRVLVSLRLRSRAVATSAANRRRWRVGREVAHHLIDPRTGRPATSDLAQVTVVAATAELADVLAKTAFLLGVNQARELLHARSELGAVLVHDTGAVELIGRLELAEVDDA
ncbi:MAG TPA: FAD:protein FMN transferase [Kofleriaceae bacterium]|jgi:thiamine biosynthesis lipoprotein|nr:FAD:protein FMN transferase [Kofleriaceae bacterium]